MGKAFLKVIIVVSFLFSFSGCGGGSTSSDTTVTNNPPQNTEEENNQTQVTPPNNDSIESNTTSDDLNTQDNNTTTNSSNNAPIIQTIADINISEDTIYSFEVNASDEDGDNLTYFVTSSDVNITGVVLEGNRINLVPNLNWYGEANITVVVDDGNTTNNSDSTTFKIIVNPVNDNPIVGGTFALLIDEDNESKIGGNIVVDDNDTIFGVDENRLATSYSGGNYGSFIVDSNGSWTYELNTSSVQILGNGSSFVDELNVTTFDGSTTKKISVTINGQNDAPAFETNLISSIVNENNGTRSYELNVSDFEGDDLNISIESNNTSIVTVASSWDMNSLLNQANYDGITLEFNLSTVQDASGLVNIVIFVTDNELNTTSTYEINVAANGNPLIYLNSIRSNAGLVQFSYNSLLEQSSQNHANYIVETNEVGHYENNTSATNYTGNSPTDRGGYVGYKAGVGENLTTNTILSDYTSSIDQLMTAIYHRFGFLEITYDEVGFGTQSDSYTAHVYNMGKSYLNTMCSGDSFNGAGFYYTNVCNDTNFRVEATAYENVHNTIKNQSDAIITWPYENQNNFQVAFYEESPDPLPDCGVTGNPISIEFNDNKIESNITMNYFKLYDGNGSEYTNTRILDKNSDPNGRFSNHQFVMFPMERLIFDSNYSVVFNYDENGATKEKSWSFSTREIGYPYFQVEDVNNSYDIISGKTYAVYVKPDNCNDTAGSLSWAYNTSGGNPDIAWLDKNTFTIKATGNIGEMVDINVTGNSKLIYLTISSTDNGVIE